MEDVVAGYEGKTRWALEMRWVEEEVNAAVLEIRHGPGFSGQSLTASGINTEIQEANHVHVCLQLAEAMPMNLPCPRRSRLLDSRT